MKYVVITETDGESFTEPSIIKETELDFIERRTDELTAGTFSVHVICHFTHPPSPISYRRKSLQELSDSNLVNLAWS